jgi:hypothetical protein
MDGPGDRVGRDRLDIEPILLGLFFQLESVLSFDGLRIQRVQAPGFGFSFRHCLGWVYRGRRSGLLQRRPPENPQASSTIPLESHEALALTCAQQIEQPHEPVSPLVEAALGGS